MSSIDRRPHRRWQREPGRVLDRETCVELLGLLAYEPGLSQQQLAAGIGADRGTMSRILHGAVPVTAEGRERIRVWLAARGQRVPEGL